MSYAYDEYLFEHREGLVKGIEWFKENLPEVLLPGTYDAYIIERRIRGRHDLSKESREEYKAYDDYFYGVNKSPEVCQKFNEAWLHHIHHNKHHWQHWVLINDDEEEGTIALDMPYEDIIEMICDWWSFSWRTGNLNEIFNWYGSHRERIIFSEKTRETVEDILNKMKNKLDEQ